MNDIVFGESTMRPNEMVTVNDEDEDGMELDSVLKINYFELCSGLPCVGEEGVLAEGTLPSHTSATVSISYISH